MEWAITNRILYNIRVINLSLGHPSYEPAAQDLIGHRGALLPFSVIASEAKQSRLAARDCFVAFGSSQ